MTLPIPTCRVCGEELWTRDECVTRRCLSCTSLDDDGFALDYLTDEEPAFACDDETDSDSK